MPFTFSKVSELEGPIVIAPKAFPDARGFFLETYKQSDFAAAGIGGPFVQDNHSCSKKDVIRGLHYQAEPYAQGKLVSVVRGAVLDVVVDIDPNSSTFLKWYSITLTADDHTMLYIPAGFAHGVLSLEDDTHLLYKCTKEYRPDAERGIRFDDPRINISWGVSSPIVSDTDLAFPTAAEAFQLA